jgi:DnaJ-class molecular chaperone
VVLGVARTATADELKQVYRKMARELHPDLNPGNARSEERFKEVSAAYDFLSDPDKRARFDAGEIDATGTQKRTWRGPQGAQGGGGRRAAGGFNFGDDADDIFSELLRRKTKSRFDWGSAAGAGASGRGQDARHALTVSFVEAAAGCTKRVTLVTGKSLDVRIPAGATDGQSLRLKAQGHPGNPAGDAFIDIAVEAHAYFSRRDLDVLLTLPISLQEAVLGGKVTAPTIDGNVTLSVPPGSNTGSVLRLKSRGITGPTARGDQLVTLSVVLPEDDADLKKFVDKWGPRHGYDPRAKMG